MPNTPGLMAQYSLLVAIGHHQQCIPLRFHKREIRKYLTLNDILKDLPSLCSTYGSLPLKERLPHPSKDYTSLLSHLLLSLFAKLRKYGELFVIYYSFEKHLQELYPHILEDTVSSFFPIQFL